MLWLTGFGMVLGGILGMMTQIIDIWTRQITGGGAMFIRPGWEGFAVATMAAFGSVAGLIYAVILYDTARLDGVRKHEFAIFLSTLIAGAVIYIAAEYLCDRVHHFWPWLLAQLMVFAVGLMIACLMARPSRRTSEPVPADKL